MAPITLRKILRKDAGRILATLLHSLEGPVGILDLDGELLLGKTPPIEGWEAERIPVSYGGQTLGWVTGGQEVRHTPGIAALLEMIYAQEVEKRELAAEVLDKYRELHLLYRLSEKLATSPQPEVIGHVAVTEICSLFEAASGIVILAHEQAEGFEVIASCGHPYQLKPEARNSPGIIGQVLRSGQAQLGNNLPGGESFLGLEDATVSLLCAPLRTKKGVFGGIILIRDASHPFAAGDLKLMNAVAMQTSPAIEIAHLYRLELENVRMERDLQTARQVQSGMLPHRMPVLEGWRIAAFWQPARIVSGDLYDFIYFPSGKLGLVIADVTDKGVPAALFMANTRSVLRGVVASAGRRGADSPGKLLRQVNEVLCDDIAMKMFVTCLLIVLDPSSGHLRFANAGHNLPYQIAAQEVFALRATGVPLGIFPDSEYEEQETILAPGDSLLMYSDGLVEAHDEQGEMFGSRRLLNNLAGRPGEPRLVGNALIEKLMAQLAEFTGPSWEQEDDVTLVTLHRCG
jgi:serine phosphatase RsbU (regulator of sigma subunit)